MTDIISVAVVVIMSATDIIIVTATATDMMSVKEGKTEIK